jgi:hypothetical protein
MKSLIKYITAALVLITVSTQAQFITNNGLPISNTALVVTNGSWNNDAGTNILNNGIIETSESFTNSGTLDPAGTGGFVLKFATDFSFTPGGSQLGFLTKLGAGKALIAGTVSVKDSLVLNEGVLQLLKPTDTVAIQPSAILKVAPLSYVEGGLVSRGGVGTLNFPLGRDGNSLHLTLYKVLAEKIAASVIDAPTSPVAGSGIDAFIDFPYAWKVQKKASADTAAYVELSYTDNLPTVINPIVVRETTANTFTSMGARFIDQSSGRVTVRSYSRGLNGLYTIAQGFPSDPVTDSLALVALYNAASGTSWSDNSNWTTGPIDSWFGLIFSGQTISALQLPSNNLAGPVPDQLTDILGLQIIDLSNNSITSLPDFSSNTDITQLDVSNNKLDFASLEPNAAVTGFTYTGQGAFGSPVDSLVQVGSAYTLVVNAGGNNTTYQWSKNNEIVAGATAPTYELASVDRSTMGEFSASASNALLPGLVLNSQSQKVQAYATISGTLSASENVPATSGELTLFRIGSNAFDTTGVAQVEADGSFIFEKVILDDYQLLGFADTLIYERALPTYYTNTIFWEEADTIRLENHVSNIAIVSAEEPLPPSGHGVISGYLQQDDGLGRTNSTMKPKRVSDAGVCARRVERTGRPKGEELTLVAYVFTNENGEFTMTNLPEGDYRLNIQYPGYPMDTTSFVTITIGNALKSQVQVEANVVDGKISVRKLLITEIYERQDYKVELYPNPAVESIKLKFMDELEGRSVLMMDMSGKTVLKKDARRRETDVNVNNLDRGLYLLQVTDKGIIVKTMKVSIE